MGDLLKPVGQRTLFLLYDVLLAGFGLLLVPIYALRRMRPGKVRHGVRERFGFHSWEWLEKIAGREVIWIHAVSVGETRACIPLVRALKETWPGAALVLSNVTETGHSVGRGIPEFDHCLYFPFDFSRAVRKVLGRVRPTLVILMETEIWPNFLSSAHEMKIPVVLANGRISDRSYPRYRRLSPLLGPLVKPVAAFCMQSEGDAERIRRIGALPERVHVTRNLKFDVPFEVPGERAVRQSKVKYHLPSEGRVWVCGSTHAGEEEMIVSAFSRLRREHPDLLLVLIPRHPGRCRGLAETLRCKGVPVVLRSELAVFERSLRPEEVLLVNTIGEAIELYSLAEVVFVGGSLVRAGGHNVLEPAMVKKPVVFGPYMGNFKEIAQLLEGAGGGETAADEADLVARVRSLLDEPQRRRDMGAAGHRLLLENRGATLETIAIIKNLPGMADDAGARNAFDPMMESR